LLAVISSLAGRAATNPSTPAGKLSKTPSQSPTGGD
jgi:hypothetical protein